MRSVTRMFLCAAAITAMGATPALAQKAPGPKPGKAAAERGEVPRGILIAMQKAFPQVGHGSDVPRGNGKGWGHLLHNHDDETPVSP